MKNLIQLTAQERLYLKQKWSVENTELDREIIKAENQLNYKLQMQALVQDEIDSLTIDLTNAENLLNHLTNTSAPQYMINKQQSVFDQLKTQLDNASKESNVLTDTQAYLQQTSIEELKLKKQYRQNKILELDAIQAA